MKRTNLVLNEDLLEKAVQVFGVKTYSEAVNRALGESIQLHQIRALSELMGEGHWEGDLSEMRGDSTNSARVRARTKPGKRRRKK